MIPYKIVHKIMSGRGVLFYSLRARVVQLSDEELLAMIAGSTVRMTPQVGNLINANLEIQLSHGNMYHYVFLYSRDGSLITASQFNSGRWEACEIIQPQRKAG